MTAEAATQEGRSAAESLMTLTFAAYSPDATARDSDGMKSRIFTSQGTTPGKVAGRSREGDTNTRYISIGGINRPVLESGLHLPLSAPLPAVGWEYLCTAGGPTSDPSLIGRRYRVVDVPAKSFVTARRLDVVEVS